jgi:hypothetical protein
MTTNSLTAIYPHRKMDARKQRSPKGGEPLGLLSVRFRGRTDIDHLGGSLCLTQL